MKILISENRLYQTIEKYLQSSYPGIHTIEFDEFPRGKYVDGEFVTKNIISVTIVFKENGIPDTAIERMMLKQDIIKNIEKLFGLENPRVLFFYLERTTF
jgi:hypothetical protein